MNGISPSTPVDSFTRLASTRFGPRSRPGVYKHYEPAHGWVAPSLPESQSVSNADAPLLRSGRLGFNCGGFDLTRSRNPDEVGGVVANERGAKAAQEDWPDPGLPPRPARHSALLSHLGSLRVMRLTSELIRTHSHSRRGHFQMASTLTKNAIDDGGIANFSLLLSRCLASQSFSLFLSLSLLLAVSCPWRSCCLAAWLAGCKAHWLAGRPAGRVADEVAGSHEKALSYSLLTFVFLTEDLLLCSPRIPQQPSK